MMPRIDWSFGPGRHPVMGAGLSGASALSTTMVAFLASWPWWWPLAAGVTMGLVAAGTAGWQDMPGAAVAYRGICWVAAGGWSTWTITVPDGGPWSRWPLGLLGLGTAAAATVGTALARMEAREQPAKPAAQAGPAPKDPVAAEWQQRIHAVTRILATVHGSVPWSPPTGHTLDGTLPDNGTTLSDLKQYEGALASAADLPEGCNVEILPAGGRRRQFKVRVATENAMAETHHLPDDTSPLTINEPLPVGIHADRSQASINLRFSSGVLVGQKGSGKSNILNVITHQLVRCPDVLVWAIDQSGNGRFPRPWIRPWYEGHCDTPAIDWAAVTEQDTELMCLAAIQVINGRTAAYQQLMHEVNDDKVPARPDLPQIVVLVDEMGTLSETIKDYLTTISDTGRGAAVQVLACGLRANAKYIPSDMKVQARERIAMRVTDENELQYLFDATWSRGRFDPASIPYEGSGMLATGAISPAPYKAWRAEPNRITAASIAVARLRPGLDEVSRQLVDPVVRRVRDKYGEWTTEQIPGVYEQRWQKTLPLMFPAVGSPAARPTAVTAAAATATIAPPQQDEEEPVNLEDSQRDLEQSAGRLRRAREAAEAAEPEGEEIDWSVPESWLEQSTPQQPARPHPKVRMRQIVQEHRRDGTGPRAVWEQLREEGYPTAEPTVIGWMRADLAAGVLAQPGGEKTPYTPGPNFEPEA